jgi:hypothetical protein
MFKFMRKAVDGIMSQITNQLSSVRDAVESPIKEQLKTILDGAWAGDDAEAMANEIDKVVLPMVADLLAAIGGMNTGISQATDNIDKADKKAHGVVEELVGVFGSIF